MKLSKNTIEGHKAQGTRYKEGARHKEQGTSTRIKERGKRKTQSVGDKKMQYVRFKI